MLALWTLILPIVWATEFTFYTVEFQPGNSAGFTSLSGEMVVPPYPGASQTFLWPGLQDQTGWGVLQPVLEAEPVLASRQTGQSGSWTFTPGWYNKSASKLNDFRGLSKEQLLRARSSPTDDDGYRIHAQRQRR